MADNITLDPGSGGSVVATDDDGTAHHQYVKLEAGADGTQTKILAGGGVEAGALRVTVASDSTGVLSVDDNGSTISVDDGGGALTVDGTVAISGTVAVTDNSSTLSVDDGAGSLTVDGTVAATQSGTWTVQPGNTANTTAWKVDGSAVTQPVSDAGGSLTVDYATTGSGTATGALRVELPTNGTGTVGLNAGTNAIGKLAANSGVDIGDVDVTSIAAGTNTIGNVGVVGRTTGGLSMFISLDLDETEEDVKTSAGQLFGWYMFNAAATTRYVKLYNATAANVTVGSTTPVLVLPVPAGGAANAVFDIGIAFSTAICAAATTGVANSDTGAPSANDVVVNFLYV